MSYDFVEDSTTEKPIKAPKKINRPPYCLLPRHISETVSFLQMQIASRPRRPKRNGGFRSKSERLNQSNHS